VHRSLAAGREVFVLYRLLLWEDVGGFIEKLSVECTLMSACQIKDRVRRPI